MIEYKWYTIMTFSYLYEITNRCILVFHLMNIVPRSIYSVFLSFLFDYINCFDFNNNTHSNEENTAWLAWFTCQRWWLSCRSESSIFTFELFTINYIYFLKVFCRLRPPKDNTNDQQTDNSSSCVKIASSTELILYSSEVSEFLFISN